ncbi:hypothetical protein M0812_19449 [Anaeramoeba flamelloides]|uniref:Uncharacterized protein n=1 Tax=Anaeramoeba flamelloides TaxID=1746091 RepID=A0AAV7Z1B7_9EUKA|nr:hypothetical protein M0812_19449 [Anaeramoeba flamelloides]
MSFDNKLDVSMIDLLDICIESNIPLTALDKILKVCYSLLLRNPPRTTLYRSEKGLQSVSLLRHKLSTKFKAQKKSQIKAQNSDSILNNLEEDEIPICISFFYDIHEVNKKQNVGGFYFFIENLPVWWARRDESIFLISNILEEFNFYSYQHLLNLQKELLSLKRGFIFEKQKYKVFFLKFYSDSKEINQAVGRKDPNAHNQCPYCDQVSIPKKNLQNNEYYSSKIKKT